MPTYEYLCTSCQHKFEEFQGISEAGLLFKGSGFYKTDYRSDGYKKKAKEEKEKSSPSPKSEKKKD